MGDMGSMCCCEPPVAVFDFVAMHLGGPANGYPGTTNQRPILGLNSHDVLTDSYLGISEHYTLADNFTSTGDAYQVMRTAASNYYLALSGQRCLRVNGDSGSVTTSIAYDFDVASVINRVGQIENYVAINENGWSDRRGIIEIGSTLYSYRDASGGAAAESWSTGSTVTSHGSPGASTSLVLHTSQTCCDLVFGLRNTPTEGARLCMGTASLGTNAFSLGTVLDDLGYVHPTTGTNSLNDINNAAGAGPYALFYHANRSAGAYCVGYILPNDYFTMRNLTDYPTEIVVNGTKAYAPHEHTYTLGNVLNPIKSWYQSNYPGGTVPPGSPLPPSTAYPAETSPPWLTSTAIRRAAREDTITGTPYVWFEAMPQWAMCFEDNTDADALICFLEFTAGLDDPTVTNNTNTDVVYWIRERYEWWKGGTLVQYTYGRPRNNPGGAGILRTNSKPHCSVGSYVYLTAYLWDLPGDPAAMAWSADATSYFAVNAGATVYPDSIAAAEAPAILSENFPWNDPVGYTDLESLTGAL